MSTNHHTAIALNAPATSATVNNPLGQLDQALTNLLAGDLSFTQANFGSTFPTKTIASGSITADRTAFNVDTEASASTDDLDNFSGGTTGDFFIMRIANASRIVTIRHNATGSGNIRTWNSKDLRLDTTNQLIIVYVISTTYYVLPLVNSVVSMTPLSATISVGVITKPNSSRIIVDTEGSSATDDLDTISAGINGEFLLISSTNASRDVVLKHNTGNIYFTSGVDLTLTDPREMVLLVYDTTSSRWIGLKPQTPTLKDLNSNTVSAVEYRLPTGTLQTSSHFIGTTGSPYLDLLPNSGFLQPRTLVPTDTTLSGTFGTLTVSGTPSNENPIGSDYPRPGIRWQSGASSGNLGGVISPFNLTNMNALPFFRITFVTYSSIATLRFWIGLSSAAIGNNDSPSDVGTHFVGLRYSSVAGDSAVWRFVTSDGSSTNVISSGIGVATNTLYEFAFYVDNTSSVNRVNFFLRRYGGTPGTATNTTTTNLPTSGLGLNARVETREAVAKSLIIGSVALIG